MEKVNKFNEYLTELLVGCPYAKLTVTLDDRLVLDFKGYSETIDTGFEEFPFHTRLGELACLSPGSVFEFHYKCYPPSVFCSLNGIKDIAQFLVPKIERLHDCFSSNGLHMFLINSPMEKMKLFKGSYENFTGVPEQYQIRDSIKDAFWEACEYNFPIRKMRRGFVAASRLSYFGMTVPAQYEFFGKTDDYIDLILPGICVVGELENAKDFQKDLVVWLMLHPEVFEIWKVR